MLSSKALHQYKKVIKYGWRLGVIPYTWNDKKGRVEFRRSRLFRLFWSLQFGLYCLYESFLMFRWLWALADKESSGPERAVNLQYVTWGGMFLVSQHYSTWKNYGLHHTMINRFLDHFEWFQRKHHKVIEKNQENGKRSECAGFMKKFFIFGTANTILNFISIFRRPHSPHLVTSVLPRNLKAPAIFPFAVYHAYIGLMQWFTCYFYNFTIIVYLFGMQQILQCLRHDLGGRRTFEHMASHSFVLRREFRSLQLLQGHFNQLFKVYLAQLQLLLIITITLGYFAGFSLQGSRGFQTSFLATMFLLIFVTMWNYLAEVHVRSNSVLQGWQVTRGLPEMSQFLNSCRPISTKIGDFLHADKALVLGSLAVIIDLTTTMLLNVQYS
ncbi:unnamed protein product [Allacma fusca]|uniref:Uncharacterized protein n=1 Tax=Allacma fusca TaxID=39272 RepID=A0A8J2Q3G8_9HEXA|nr:unnamed protein product [Allacma fusca]